MIPYGSILPKLTERSWETICRRNGVDPKRMTAILRARWIAEQTQATFFRSILEQNEKRRQAMARRTANSGAAPAGAQVAAAAGTQSNDPLAALGGMTATAAPAADPMAALAGLGQQTTQAPPQVQIQSSPGLDALAPQVSRDSINAHLGAGPSLNGGGHDPALAAAVQATQQKVDGILAQLKAIQAAIETNTTQQQAGFQEIAKGIGAVMGKVQEVASAASAATAAAPAQQAAPQTPAAATPGAAPAAATGAPADAQKAAMDQVISIIVPAIQEKYKDPNFPRLGVEPQNVNVETILSQVLASHGVNLPGQTIVAVLKARGHVQNGVITV